MTIDEQVAVFRAELDALPTGRHPKPWTVWRDPLTWAIGAVTLWLLVMTIVG